MKAIKAKLDALFLYLFEIKRGSGLQRQLREFIVKTSRFNQVKNFHEFRQQQNWENKNEKS